MPKKISGTSTNDQLANFFVTLTANLQRLSAEENIIVQGILKDLELDIVKKLQDNPDMSSWRKARYNALLSQTRDTIKVNYSKISEQHQGFLEKVGEVTGGAVDKIFSGVGIPLQSVIVTPEQWKTIASRSMVNGAPSAAWWEKQSQNLQDAFVQQMRIGYASGESVDDLVKRVRGTPTGKKNNYEINGKTKVFVEFQGGIMDTGTRQAQALVRTSVQQMAADSKMEMFRKNADILKGMMWLSTLDSRTTPLCRSRDGLLYDLDGQPIGHDNSFLGGPPAHWNCRSTLVPVTKSFEELGGTPGVTADYLEQIGEGTRASMNGQVPASLTFDSWFNTLPKEDQIAFLGPKKYKIWKEAGLNFIDMVNSVGNPLTLQQLANAYGFKIKESVESKIPNIPKEMVSAIAVEQQAQILASKIAQEDVDKMAQEALAAAQAEIDKIAKSKNAFIQPVWEAYGETLEGTPQENLAFLNEQIKQEKSAQMALKKVIKNIDEQTKDPESANYQAMEQKLALDQVKDIKLPSQKLAAYKNALSQIKATNAAIKKELAEWQDTNPYMEGLIKDFKKFMQDGGHRLPVWDMAEYKAKFDVYVQDLEKKATDILSEIPDDPVQAAIHSEALKKAKSKVQAGLKGSAMATLEEYDKAKALFEKQQKAAAKKIEYSLKEDFGYEKALAAVKAENPGLVLNEDLLQKAHIKYQELKASASEELDKIGDSLAEQKALKKLKEFKLWNPIEQLEKYKELLSQTQVELANTGLDAVKGIIGSHELDGSILNIGSKSFDITNAQDVADFKKYKSMHLSKFKKSIIEGEPVKPVDQLIYDNLSPEEKQAFDDSLAKALDKKSTEIIPPTSNAVPEEGVLSMAQMEKYRNQKGSNTGGFYRDLRTGTEYYIKFPASEDIARNELLAAKLYEALDVDVPELTLLWDGDRVGIASKIRPGSESSARVFKQAIGMQNNFAVDAWLANWDVAGLDYDNLLLTRAGTVVRIDVGGSLRYRAQGGLKGAAFGNSVTELETLRDPKKNAKSAAVFKDLKKEDLEAGVRKVLELSDDKIRELVKEYGPRDSATAQELADTLIARKEYLAKRFPHLAEPTPVPLPEDVNLLVGEADMIGIKNGRINGFAIPADTDQIEDQSILAWFEKDEKGNEYTGLRFKYTEQASKQIFEKIEAGLDDETDTRRERLLKQFQDFKKQLHAQWNVFHNKEGLEIDKKIAAKNIQALEASLADLSLGLSSYDPDFSKIVLDTFIQPVQQIAALVETQEVFKPAGIIATGKFQDSDLYDFEFTAEAKSREKVASDYNGLVFRKVPGTFYAKDIKDGYAVVTNRPLGGTGLESGTYKEVYEATTSTGVRIRIWAGQDTGGRALESQIEILAPGASKKVVNETLELIQDELGISVAAPKEEEQGEMYLRMIARHRGDWYLLDEADELKGKGATASEIYSFLKEELSRDLGRDITKEAGYNPVGNREAFDSGFRRWYTPEIDTDPEWKKLQKDYILFHDLGKDIPGTLDKILNSGGKMVPTANKLRYGIPWGGWSPEPDMRSGGADYIFTRLYNKKRREVTDESGLRFDARLAGRLDTILYSADLYGRTTEDTVRRESVHGVENMKKAAKRDTNELIFKGGLSLFDGLSYVNCRTREEARTVLAIFAKHGWKDTWVDGRKITDLVRVGGKVYK